MRRTYAMILAGGMGSRLCLLSEKRAKPAVPFGGKYRIIDFTLSNCVNSEIYDVGILTQYRPLSLIEHIGIGRPWDLDRRDGGAAILQPHVRATSAEWYRGTGDAVWRNRNQILRRGVPHTLVLSGDHVYKMDYRLFLDAHEATGADLTIAVTAVPIEKASQFGVVALDADGRIVGFEEKPAEPKSNLISMGVYVFRSATLLSALEEDALADGGHDFGKNLIPRLLESGKVVAYVYGGYWQDIGTLDSYYESNMALLTETPALALRDPGWVIHTVTADLPPAEIASGARVRSSFVTNGAVIEGTVERSVLSPGVHVGKGAVVRDSIVMANTTIGEGTRIERTILDKDVRIGREARIGGAGAARPNVACPEHLHSGITVVGKGAVLPDGVVVGLNCRIAADLRPEDMEAMRITDGSAVERRGPLEIDTL
jgi:glucose-1-phosphate adenylyltransferase